MHRCEALTHGVHVCRCIGAHTHMHEVCEAVVAALQGGGICIGARGVHMHEVCEAVEAALQGDGLLAKADVQLVRTHLPGREV